MYPLWEREMFLVVYSTEQCFLQCFSSWKWRPTNHELSFVRGVSMQYFLVDFRWRDLHGALIRVNSSYALIIRTSSPRILETFLRTSVFRVLGTWSSESSSLRQRGRSSEHAVFKVFRAWVCKVFRGWTVHQNFWSQNFWKASGIEQTRFWIRISALDVKICLTYQEHIRVPKLFIHLKYLLSSKHRDLIAEPNLVLTISPFLMMTKLYFNDTILKSITINIEVSQETYQNLGLENIILL